MPVCRLLGSSEGGQAGVRAAWGSGLSRPSAWSFSTSPLPVGLICYSLSRNLQGGQHLTASHSFFYFLFFMMVSLICNHLSSTRVTRLPKPPVLGLLSWLPIAWGPKSQLFPSAQTLPLWAALPHLCPRYCVLATQAAASSHRPYSCHLRALPMLFTLPGMSSSHPVPSSLP